MSGILLHVWSNAGDQTEKFLGLFFECLAHLKINIKMCVKAFVQEHYNSLGLVSSQSLSILI